MTPDVHLEVMQEMRNAYHVPHPDMETAVKLVGNLINFSSQKYLQPQTQMYAKLRKKRQSQGRIMA